MTEPGHESAPKQSEQAGPKESTSTSFSFKCETLPSLGVNGELINNVKVFDHIAEFIEGQHAIVVGVTLDDSAVYQLLQLHVGEVGTHHHFQHGEEFTVGDEAVIVHVVDLEGETQLLFTGGSSRQRVKSMNELKEGNASILVLI